MSTANSATMLYENTNQSWSRWIVRNVPSYLVSAVVHALIVLLMAFLQLAPPKKSTTAVIEAKVPEETQEIEDFEEQTVPILKLDPELTQGTSTADFATAVTQDLVDTDTPVDVAVADPDMAQMSVDDFADIADRTAPRDAMAEVGAAMGKSAFANRGAAMRSAANLTGGGTKASDIAVGKALKWLAEHQNPDGSWNFDHRQGPCRNRCGNAGDMTDCRTGATALALLPFLGYGITHKEGEYKDTVERGLYFLVTQMKVSNGAGNLMQGGGNMYSHGLAAICLCEAYAMTNDRKLAKDAQLAINFIEYAQDRVGGGWRYVPHQPGDTSVVGWQLMALKSAAMGNLTVHSTTLTGVNNFLNSVQQDDGAVYGYVDPGAGEATTAVGLLCRMYMGWKKDHPALKRGVEYLANQGPSEDGRFYYNYYATQVLRHYEGPLWEKWNTKLREHLVRTQSQTGHQTGSWYIEGPEHGIHAGGRLYATSMATMILEVYYRHLPLYRESSVEDDFEL